MATPAFSHSAALPIQKQLEDPLAYLHCSTILRYRKGQLIYNQDQPATSLFVVISGRVKVSRVTNEGKLVAVDVYQVDEFFGESAFLGSPTYGEQATAVGESQVMAWNVAEVEDLMTKRPRLGIALLQILTGRTTEFKARIECLALDTIERRIARTLVRLSERFGEVQENGCVTMMPVTHELLAQFVGTSREIITHHMNSLRKQSYLHYSRKGIILKRELLRQYLQENA